MSLQSKAPDYYKQQKKKRKGGGIESPLKRLINTKQNKKTYSTNE